MPGQTLDDARLVLRYATARGLLPDNALPNAIAQAEQRLDVHGNLPADAEAELSKALNAAAKLILPMTIDRLRSQEDAENLTGWKRRIYVSWAYVTNLFTPIVVYALCVALIVLIIPWTTQFNRLASFAAELKETEKQDVVSLLEEDRLAFQKLQTPARTAPPRRGTAPQTGAGKPEDDPETKHQQRLKTLRELDSKISINLHSITDTIDIETGEPYLWKMIAHTYGLGYEKKEPRPAVKSPAPIVETQPRPPRPNAAAPAQQPDSVRPRSPDECDSIRTPLVCKTFSYGDANGFWVNSPSRLQAALKARRQAESVGALLGSSILPVLYGLLGATVFLLRGYLGESDPAGVARRPLAATAFLRLGLGGIAGLAIGWFWVPKAGVENSFQTTPFALAFLAGFSIELLFSLLDRILNAVNPRTQSPSGG